MDAVCDPSDLEDLKSKCAWNQWFNSNIFVLSRSVLLLLKNPTFIFLCLAGATEATLIAGMSTFGPKFLESQFSLSASEAATFFGKENMFLQCFPILPTNRRALLAHLEWRQMLCSLIMDWLSPSVVGWDHFLSAHLHPLHFQSCIYWHQEEVCHFCSHLLPSRGRQNNCNSSYCITRKHWLNSSSEEGCQS